MRLDLYEYETNEGLEEGGGGDAAAGAVEEATPSAEASVAEAASTGTSIDWDAISQHPEFGSRVAQMTDERFSAWLESLNEGMGQPEEESGPPSLDPFSDNFEQDLQQRDEWMLGRFEKMLDSRFGQINPVIQDIQAERSQEQADHTISSVQSELGTSYEAEEALPWINAEVSALTEGYDVSRLAPYQREQLARQATKTGIEKLNAYTAKVRAEAQAELRASFEGANGDTSTPYEPGVRGSALATERVFKDELDVARAYDNRTAV